MRYGRRGCLCRPPFISRVDIQILVMQGRRDGFGKSEQSAELRPCVRCIPIWYATPSPLFNLARQPMRCPRAFYNTCMNILAVLLFVGRAISLPVRMADPVYFVYRFAFARVTAHSWMRHMMNYIMNAYQIFFWRIQTHLPLAAAWAWKKPLPQSED